MFGKRREQESTSTQPNKLRKPRPESRTMALAKGMLAQPTSRESTTTIRIPRVSTGPNVQQEVSKPSFSGSSTAPMQQYATIYNYFSQSTQNLLHPISAVEHYWTVRATRAEALLVAHGAHQEARARELSELNARYEREHARIQRMVWITLSVVVAAFGTAALLLLRTLSVGQPNSRWPGPMHFTIPVLSPFASVVENETSAVNTQLVALLLVAAGVVYTLRSWCSFGR